jgi:hypothetical protein
MRPLPGGSTSSDRGCAGSRCAAARAAARLRPAADGGASPTAPRKPATARARRGGRTRPDRSTTRPRRSGASARAPAARPDAARARRRRAASSGRRW